MTSFTLLINNNVYNFLLIDLQLSYLIFTSFVMTITTKRTEIIRRFLLNGVKANSSHLIQDAMETFGLSRQAIHKHLAALVAIGYLTAVGNTSGRSYHLGLVRNHSATFQLQGLQESEVYRKDFGFVFSDLPKELENISHYGFTEMLNNAIDHSGGTEVAVSVARTVESITIVMVDNGEGIFNHIARLLGLGDPRESLLELSKGKLTTDPENHTGQGIFFSSRAFDVFFIASDDLAFVHHDKRKNDYLLHEPERVVGTRVFMQMSLDSNKTMKAIFDAFTGGEEDDFAFNKTVVPVHLALYEGESLVSRSQAKRILNRVEKFIYVVLDFDGVDAIGQAFADEVFRVFARKNPQITLSSINMTEDVRRMVQAAVNYKD